MMELPDLQGGSVHVSYLARVIYWGGKKQFVVKLNTKTAQILQGGMLLNSDHSVPMAQDGIN